jgi:hypothetical protein
MDGKLVLGIFLLPFKISFVGLKYVFTHRATIIIAIIALVIFFGFKHFHQDTGETEREIPAYQKIIPQEAYAPRVVQTLSRYYPFATFQENEISLTLTDYYVYDRKQWRHETRPLVIDKTRIVKIYTR